MSYITTEDIKANLIAGFDISGYIEEAGQEIEDVAQRLGVSVNDISLPLHYKIKRYGIAYLLKRLAQDKIGTNQPDVTLEKYKDMYELYSTEVKELFPQLTYQMFTGTVKNIIGRTSSNGFYRG